MNEIQPGETVYLVRFENVETAVGTVRKETLVPFTYEQIMSLINGAKVKTSRKAKTAGARFSKVISLALYAIETGYYTNGAAIDSRFKVIGRLVDSFNLLDKSERVNITAKVLTRLLKVSKNGVLTNGQSDLLLDIHDQIVNS